METTIAQGKKIRGALPDAEIGQAIHLIKATTHLRLTYQIKLLAYLAKSKGKKLVVHLPKGATAHQSLDDFVKDMGGSVVIDWG